MVLFANVFPYSRGCVFVWWIVSFAVKKLLNLIRSRLYIFPFVSFALGDKSKIHCYYFIKEYSAYVDSQSILCISVCFS